MKITKTHVYFWSSFLGNWSKVPQGIKYDGKVFPTAEHIFMYIKAKTFKDKESMSLIEQAISPKEAKDIGRRVKGYKDDVWESYRINAMYDALVSRVKCDTPFKEFLINHSGFTFVEASPYDRIWGVGLSEDDPLILDEGNWKGRNLLGQVMSQVARWAKNLKVLNTWVDDLIRCPSQCYYYFYSKDGELLCLYLRWRHSDPWTAELVPVDEIKFDFKYDGWKSLDPPRFKETELDQLKEWSMKKLKELELI